MNYVETMAMIDIQDFFNKIFKRKNFTVKIIDSTETVTITVKNTDKKLLTIKERV